MTAVALSESLVDYTGFDFAGLWPGRERVTEVESTLLARALAGCDRRRLLEIGTGYGRLLPVVRAAGDEIVATDLDASALAQVPEDARVRRVAANVYHLPFVDNAFSGATLVRLYHHLTDPPAAFAELARVLGPGARLVVSYKPKPSVGTLVDDVTRALRRREEEPFRTLTFSSGPVVLFPGSYPIRSNDRRGFAAEARGAGWAVAGDAGSGFEEYTVLRARVPAAWFVALGDRLAAAPGFPTRFVRLERPGLPPTALPPIDRILACPACHRPGVGEWSHGELACATCGYRGARRGAVLDLRYAPEGTPRWAVPR